MDTSELGAKLAQLHPQSFGWALASCHGDQAQAEDVLQSAYLKVLDGRARFGGEATFKTWLFGVIRNGAREERRRHLLCRAGLLRYEPALPPNTNPEKELAQKEYYNGIRAALQKLSSRQQEVLHLVFYQELTIAEAAFIMKVSLGSARTHYERGKRQLRKHLNYNER